MGPRIFQVLAFLTLISVVCASSSALLFTNVPTDVIIGQNYTIGWTGGDWTSPITLTLQQGALGDGQDVQVLTQTTTGYSFNWAPSSDLSNGNNYGLKLSQGSLVDYSPQFEISSGYGSSPTSSTSSSSPTSTEESNTTLSTVSTTPTPTSTLTSAPASAQTGTSSSTSIDILNPTPTSSFDAPVNADTHLTINDKFALGFGIPIAFIVLSTLGYWRAMKYFMHRKITGDPKLPVYASYEEAYGGGNTGFGGFASRPVSLWGAASRRGSIMPPSTQVDFGDSTELLTAPKIVHSPADARPLSAQSHRAPSMLRQEWNAV